MKQILIFVFLLFSQIIIAQSTLITSGNQGTVQVPKLSYEQITAIQNPKAGMVAFDSTFRCLRYYTGTKWLCTSQSESNNSSNPVGFAWKKASGSTTFFDEATNLFVDSNNNIYVIGWLASGGYPPTFVAKFSPNGNLIWEYRKDTDRGDALSNLGSDIMVDSNFNVYIVASSQGNLGYNYCSVQKLNSNGELEWSNRVSCYGYIYGNKIFLDANNNVYIKGTFNGTMSIGSTSLTGNESFIAKYSNIGGFMWVKAIKNTNAVVTNTGDCIFAGYFTGSISIEANNFNSFGNEDILVGKYDANGSLSWIKQEGGNGIDKANDLRVDANGNIYVTGSFSSSSNFSGNNINSVGLEDYFIVKYQTNGTLSWIKQGGGGGIDRGRRIEFTPANEPIILGDCNSYNITFSNLTISPNQNPSTFLIKHSPVNGDLSWVKTIENAKDFKINSFGNIYTWSNPFGITNPYSSNYTFLFTKYFSDGTLIYSQRQGGRVSTMGFGTNNDFYFIGRFRGTVQMGSSNLTSTGEGDIFVSHWME